MISHKYRCIFVHQRKSAGTSVKALFPDAVGEDRRRFNNGVLDPDWRPDNALIRDYHSFTVVRNPWDRFVSGWKFCRSTRDRPLLDVLANLPRERLLSNILAPGASFAARRAYARELARRRVLQARYALRAIGPAGWGRRPHDEGHDYRHLTLQQVDTVTWPDGRLAVDRVIFMERLDEGLAALERDLGMPQRQVPRLRSRRERDDYRRYFGPAALALFNRIYARDIAMWGYDFDTGLPAAVRAGTDP